jgi:hypothetical protein
VQKRRRTSSLLFVGATADVQSALHPTTSQPSCRFPPLRSPTQHNMRAFIRPPPNPRECGLKTTDGAHACCKGTNRAEADNGEAWLERGGNEREGGRKRDVRVLIASVCEHRGGSAAASSFKENCSPRPDARVLCVCMCVCTRACLCLYVFLSIAGGGNRTSAHRFAGSTLACGRNGRPHSRLGSG